MTLSAKTKKSMELEFRWDSDAIKYQNSVGKEGKKNDLSIYFDYLQNFENSNAEIRKIPDHSERVFVL